MHGAQAAVGRRRRRSQADVVKKRLARAEALRHLRELSSARQVLVEAQLAPGSRETLNKLTDQPKRPREPRVPVPPTHGRCFVLAESEVFQKEDCGRPIRNDSGALAAVAGSHQGFETVVLGGRNSRHSPSKFHQQSLTSSGWVGSPHCRNQMVESEESWQVTSYDDWWPGQCVNS